LLVSVVDLSLLSLIFVAPASLGWDPREIPAIALPVLAVGVIWNIAVLTILAGQMCRAEALSVSRAYLNSLFGTWTALGTLLGLVLLMLMVLVLPLVGIVCALYFYVRLSVAFEASILNRSSPLAALRQAWSLTKGQFGTALVQIIPQHAAILLVSVTIAVLPVPPLVVVMLIAATLPWLVIFRVVDYFALAKGAVSLP